VIDGVRGPVQDIVIDPELLDVSVPSEGISNTRSNMGTRWSPTC